MYIMKRVELCPKTKLRGYHNNRNQDHIMDSISLLHMTTSEKQTEEADEAQHCLKTKVANHLPAGSANSLKITRFKPLGTD